MEIFFEPAVLVSIFFSVIIAMLSRRLTRLGEYLIAHISLLPIRFVTRVRIAKWRYRKNLVLTARNQHKVTWAIVRTYTLQRYFFSAFILYLLLIAIGPLKGVGSLPASVQLLIAAPIYVFEVIWLLQKDKAQALVKAAGRYF